MNILDDMVNYEEILYSGSEQILYFFISKYFKTFSGI